MGPRHTLPAALAIAILACGPAPAPRAGASSQPAVSSAPPAASASVAPVASTSAITSASATTSASSAPAPLVTWACLDDVAIEQLEGFGNTAVRTPQLIITVESPRGSAGEAPARAACSVSAGVRACFDAGPSGDDSMAGVRLEVEVDEKGKVKATKELEGAYSDRLLKCLESRFKTLAFAAGPARRLTYDIYPTPPKSPKGATARAIGTTASPGLPVWVVRRILGANLPRLRACYEAAHKATPSLHGTLDLRFSIGSDGTPTAAVVAGGTALDARLVKCTLEVLDSLAYPEPDGPAPIEVRYSIDLSWRD